MSSTKQERILEIFFRGLRGEDLSIRGLAAEYGLSPKSISRSFNDLKAFLADHRELVGNTELQYSYKDKCYRLCMDEFLSSKELFSMVEVLIGARAFSKEDLLRITGKLKQFTTPENRIKLNDLIHKELYQYPEIKHDCDSVVDTMWQLILYIWEKREITLQYYRTDRTYVEHRLRPVSLMFSDYYFYLIAFGTKYNDGKALHFRVDRIKHITKHSKKFTVADVPSFDEGLLRRQSIFMRYGELQKIKFEYKGESLQAVMDKIPTAKVVERTKDHYVIEAEVYGDGITMWLLSHGSTVKVLEPKGLVDKIKTQLEQTLAQYTD